MDEIQLWLVLLANGGLGWYVSVLTPPIPQWVPYVAGGEILAGGEIPTQLKSAKTKCVHTMILSILTFFMNSLD